MTAWPVDAGDLERARAHLRAMRLGPPTVEPAAVAPPLGHSWDLEGPDGLALELAAFRRLEWERAHPAPAEAPGVPVLTPYVNADGELEDPNVAEYARNPFWPWASSSEPAPDWREREAAWAARRPPEAPGARSLDTLATPRQRDARAKARLLEADRLKAQLAPVIRTAAGVSWGRDELEAAVWLDKRAHALEGCRDVRAFRDAGCGAYTARPSSCRVRVCPDCERSRSSRLVARLDGLTLDMRRPVFWTFTVPNVADGELGRGVDWLLEAFRRLRRRAVIRGGKCRDCGGKHAGVAGGVYSLEVTRGRDASSWHPHAHVLMDAPWIRWAELRDAWRAVTCDAIRYLEQGGGRVPRCTHPADARGIATAGCRGASVLWVEAIAGAPGSDERRGALREVLKYATGGLVKDGKLAAGVDGSSIAELLLALRGRRLVAGWGAWHHVTDEDPEDEDPAEDYVLVATGEDRDGRTLYARMPARCPCCRAPALWEAPIMVPRRSCQPRDGALIWRAPRAGPPV